MSIDKKKEYLYMCKNEKCLMLKKPIIVAKDDWQGKKVLDLKLPVCQTCGSHLEEFVPEGEIKYFKGKCNHCNKEIDIPEELYDPDPEKQHCFDCMEELF